MEIFFSFNALYLKKKILLKVLKTCESHRKCHMKFNISSYDLGFWIELTFLRTLALSITCVYVGHTPQHNKAHETNILQRHCLMLNRNIKKNKQIIYFFKLLIYNLNWTCCASCESYTELAALTPAGALNRCIHFAVFSRQWLEARMPERWENILTVYWY